MSNRAEFLYTLVASSAAAKAKSHTHDRKGRSFNFDRTRFNAILNKAATHRQCFGAKEIANGVLGGMENSINAYEDYLGEPRGSMHAVGVLYHGSSIALAMNNTVWDTILTPVMPKISADLRKDLQQESAHQGNPYAAQFESLVKRGSHFFVCNNAIMGFSSYFSNLLKRKHLDVYHTVMHGLLPGAMAVPAGVMAINAAQEAGFTYIAS